jgi:hypothetical protein
MEIKTKFSLGDKVCFNRKLASNGLAWFDKKTKAWVLEYPDFVEAKVVGIDVKVHKDDPSVYYNLTTDDGYNTGRYEQAVHLDNSSAIVIWEAMLQKEIKAQKQTLSKKKMDLTPRQSNAIKEYIAVLDKELKDIEEKELAKTPTAS